MALWREGFLLENDWGRGDFLMGAAMGVLKRWYLWDISFKMGCKNYRKVKFFRC